MFFKKNAKIFIEVSARHCHLSKTDFEKLFGLDAELKKIKQLSQPSDFACEQTVEMIVGSKQFAKVRVIGPFRKQTQIEVSATDVLGSGILPPVRLSGDLEASAPVTLIGPNGKVDLAEGLIIARRHLHCSTDEAKGLGLRHGQFISVEIKGQRALMFHCIEVRVKDDYRLSLQLDTDEGNAAGINKVGFGNLVIVKYKAT